MSRMSLHELLGLPDEGESSPLDVMLGMQRMERGALTPPAQRDPLADILESREAMARGEGRRVPPSGVSDIIGARDAMQRGESANVGPVDTVRGMQDWIQPMLNGAAGAIRATQPGAKAAIGAADGSGQDATPDPKAARRKMLQDEAWKLYMGEAPKRPPMKMAWNEILAASLNPKLLPLIFEQKRDSYLDQVDARKSRMSGIREMLGMLEPEDPVSVARGSRLVEPSSGRVLTPAEPEAGEEFTLGPGQQRFGPGGKVLASVPDRPRGAGSGMGGFTLSPGQTRYDEAGQPVVSRPDRPGAGRGGAAAGRIPAGQHGRFIAMGLNPLEPTDPGYARYEQLLQASGKTVDPKVQAEARMLYRQALGDGYGPEVASQVMQQYLAEFTPPQDDDDAALEEKIRSLMQQEGLTKEEAFELLMRQEGG